MLGPLVVAAVGCSDDTDLSGYGFKDSKQLRPSQREKLHAVIVNEFQVAIRVIPAGEIDGFRGISSMNDLLARAHAAVIRELHPALAYVDACDVNAGRYGEAVRSHLAGAACPIIAEHGADATRPVVSAASIVAKVVRDREVAEISARFGEIGSGYPSDPATIRFLDEYIRTRGKPPSCARWSWKTVSSRMDGMEQTRLNDF